MYVVDTGNEVLWILDHRAGEILGGFGSAGHDAGEFTLLHMIAINSKGVALHQRNDRRSPPAEIRPSRLRDLEDRLNRYMGSPRYEALPMSE